MTTRLVLTEDEWKLRLTAEEFRVLRKRGTERANTGCFVGTSTRGTYVCAGCANPLFTSGQKFESGTGWPSFIAPIGPDAVTTRGDDSHGMFRAEVLCVRCEGHLGHVFADGPPPAKQRYCMNSVAMKHVPA